ncbi:MAG TPA: endonuclease/exonuclease/phosphatase family protein [Longimicrobiales bacterium]|nr:endonuclease/exonuclease/phosphatase family protein [Longimicrobiales bacterium]
MNSPSLLASRGATLLLLFGCTSGAPGLPPAPASGPDLGFGAPSPVVLDGILDDWRDIPRLVEDDPAAGEDPIIDLLALSAADDPAWLYLQLQVGGALNLQSMPGTISLLVDVDGDPRTGAVMEEMEGVEFALELSPRPDPAMQEYGAGFAVRLPDGTVRSPYDVAAAGLPTHSAQGFEIRLSRTPRGGLPALGPRLRLGMVARADAAGTSVEPGGPEVVDRLPVSAYVFSSAAGPDPFVADLSVLAPPAPGAFRVATWNVGSETFLQAAFFARVLGAARPDVILLDEVYEEVSPEALQAFFLHPELDSLGEWYFVISRGGGRQKTVVAARDRTIRQEPTMVEVTYPPGALDALRRRTPERFHRALAYEAEVSLSATGAWVEVDPAGAPGREALFVPVDLQSGGWDGSPQDALRLLQAETLLGHLRRVTADGTPGVGPVPVVLAGDLNLVGGPGPLEILTGHPGSPFGPLVTADLPRLDEPTWATWRNEEQALFGPGRLDLTLYSRETLEQVGGFVLGLDGLSDAQLAALGLGDLSLPMLSDHLPMIVDLRLR